MNRRYFSVFPALKKFYATASNARQRFFPSSIVNRRSSFCGSLLYVFLLVLLLAGCQTGAEPTPRLLAEPAREEGHSARLSLFLNLMESEGPGVRLKISRLEIFGQGIWWEITEGVELGSEEIGSTQLFLGSRAMEPGRYQRLRFTLDEGLVLRDTGRYEAATSEPLVVVLDLPSPLRLEEGDSRSLFLTWDVQATLEGESLRPVITIAPQIRQMLADLIYAACPDIDTVFVIRSDKNWVADSFGIRGHPTYLAMDPDPRRQRLFVLASREPAIKVVDLSSQRVIDFFHLPLTDVPTFMTISPDGKWAYVLEERSGYLSRIDLATGRSAARVRLEYRPQYAAFLAERNQLAVSLGLTQAVSLHHPLELTETGRILTGDSPQGLLVSHNQLYVAESGDHTVSIIDPATLRSQSRLDVGFGPRRLLETDNFIYVSNYDDNSLSVLIPRQLGVLRNISGLNRPVEMVFDEVRRQLFVGEDGAASLAVIDSTSNLFTGRITLGARPVGLVILQ